MYKRALKYLRSKDETDLVDDAPVNIERKRKIGDGASKTAYSVRGDKSKVALVLNWKRPTADEIRDFLTETALQIVLHQKLVDFLDTLSPQKRRHYAHIPEVYTVSNTEKDGYFVVTERIPSTLDEDLENDPSDQKFCLCLYQVTRTITWLHKNFDFIHGDLKLNNIAVQALPSECPPYQSFIFDFGMSSASFPDEHISVVGPQMYPDITKRGNPDGPHGPNDILFLLISTYKLWRGVVRANHERKITSVLKAYMTFLLNTVYADISHEIRTKDVRDRVYALYNKNSAGPLNNAVGIDIVRAILSDFRNNQCVRRILSDDDY